MLSLTGDGSRLSFSIVGDGHVLVDLKDPTGLTVQVAGADSFTLTGDKLDLALNGLGQHNVTVTLVPTGMPSRARPAMTRWSAGRATTR